MTDTLLSVAEVAARLASTAEAYIPATATAGIAPSELRHAVELFRSVVFNGYFDERPLAESLAALATLVARQSAHARRAFLHESAEVARAEGERTAAALLDALPALRHTLSTDVKAVFDGDPAARSYEEIILCYPALVAMTHYRFAHALLAAGVPVLPRMLTERAHSLTGIDIHPAAVIGDYFSIDHGTGVVIGETCIIGSHVRLYQGVTLGAKSFKFDADGNILRQPRHPILEDNVVAYSNASILGHIRIGHDSVVGGNVWQTESLPPYSVVVQGRTQRGGVVVSD